MNRGHENEASGRPHPQEPLQQQQSTLQSHQGSLDTESFDQSDDQDSALIDQQPEELVRNSIRNSSADEGSESNSEDGGEIQAESDRHEGERLAHRKVAGKKREQRIDPRDPANAELMAMLALKGSNQKIKIKIRKKKKEELTCASEHFRRKPSRGDSSHSRNRSRSAGVPSDRNSNSTSGYTNEEGDDDEPKPLESSQHQTRSLRRKSSRSLASLSPGIYDDVAKHLEKRKLKSSQLLVQLTLDGDVEQSTINTASDHDGKKPIRRESERRAHGSSASHRRLKSDGVDLRSETKRSNSSRNVKADEKEVSKKEEQRDSQRTVLRAPSGDLEALYGLFDQNCALDSSRSPRGGRRHVAGAESVTATSDDTYYTRSPAVRRSRGVREKMLLDDNNSTSPKTDSELASGTEHKTPRRRVRSTDVRRSGRDTVRQIYKQQSSRANNTVPQSQDDLEDDVSDLESPLQNHEKDEDDKQLEEVHHVDDAAAEVAPKGKGVSRLMRAAKSPFHAAKFVTKKVGSVVGGGSAKLPVSLPIESDEADRLDN
jgi:hypothetical protein